MSIDNGTRRMVEQAIELARNGSCMIDGQMQAVEPLAPGESYMDLVITSADDMVDREEEEERDEWDGDQAVRIMEQLDLDIDELMSGALRPSWGIIRLTSNDSVAGAKETNIKPIFLNIAGDTFPGEVPQDGKDGLEERLFRQSTLLASLLSSEKARQVYEEDRAGGDFDGSPWALYSPHVHVFREADGTILGKPFEAAVLTLDGPWRGLAKPRRKVGVGQTDRYICAREKEYRQRVREFLMIAAREGKTPVLGSLWAGDFDLDREAAALCLYDVLMVDCFMTLHAEVLFSMQGEDREVVREVFGDWLVEPGYRRIPKVKGADLPMEATMPWPTCNYTEDVDEHDLGFVQGISSTGIPFVGELSEMDGQRNLSIFVPDNGENVGLVSYLEPDEEDLIPGLDIESRDAAPAIYNVSVLGVGMEVLGAETSEDVISEHVRKLMESGLFAFPDGKAKGAVIYGTDLAEMDVLQAIVTLEAEGRRCATTDLTFTPFPASRSAEDGEYTQDESGAGA